MANILTSLLKRRFVVWIGGVVLAGALVVYVLAPWLARRILVREASAALGRPVQIESVSINPFRLAVALGGVSVPDTDKSELLGWDRLVVNLSASSAWNGTLTFDEIRLTKGRVHVAILKDGRLNLAGLIPATAAKPSPSKPEKSAPSRPLVIDRLVVEDCSASYSDESQGAHFSTRVGPIHAVFDNLTTKAEESGESSFAASTESGERVAWKGRVRLQPLSSRGHVELDGIRLAKYARYIEAVSPVRVPSGLMNLALGYTVALGAGEPAVTVTGGRLEVRDLGVANAGSTRDLLDAGSVVADGIEADTVKRSVSVASVRVAGPAVSLQRFANGRMDLPASQDVKVPVKGAAASPTSPAWTIAVDSVKVEQGRVAFSDASPANPVAVKVADLTLSVDGFSTRPGTKASIDLGLKYQDTGDIRVRGKFGLEPVSADLEVRATGLQLPPVSPYLAPFVNATLAGGAARASGRLVATLAADGSPQASWLGDLGLAGIEVIDSGASTRLVSLGDLAVNGVDFHLSPVSVAIRSVVLTDPSVHAVMLPGGKLNLAALRKSAPAGQPESPAAAGAGAPAPAISIGTVELNNARLSFEDRSFQPGFSLALDSVNGRVDGLSSKDLSRANVQVTGNVNGAPMEVRGAINPLSKDVYSDVAVACNGIEMPLFTPYTGRFIGYTVAKGKLTLDLRYRLSSDVLSAENHVLLDQFYLGDSVESPDAVKLPVKLGLALLRDRNGRIDIDLPIRGNLKDPDFRYGKLVWQTVGNVLVKAAASPFSLLGSLVGDKEDLSQVTFDEGRSTLTADASRRLTDLAKALNERPDLTLEIAPAAWTASDDRGLREIALEARLRAMKWQDMAKAGLVAGDASTVTLTRDEFETYLKTAYLAAHPVPAPGQATATAGASAPGHAAPQPEAGAEKKRQMSPRTLAIWRTVMRILRIPQKQSSAAVASASTAAPAGAASAQPAGPTLADMHETLLAAESVSQLDRDKLVQDRESRIRSFLAGVGRVAPSRIFVVAAAKAPTSPAPASATGEPSVKFSLR